MTNLIPWRRPSMLSLQRDVEDVLEEYASPRSIRREMMRLFEEIPAPEPLWREIDRLFEELDAPPMLRRRVERVFEEALGMVKHGAYGMYGAFAPYQTPFQSFAAGYGPSYAPSYASSYAPSYGAYGRSQWLTPAWGQSWGTSVGINHGVHHAFGQHAWGQHAYGPQSLTQHAFGHKRMMFAPTVEIVERDNEFVLKADLPGIREQDIDLRIEDDTTLTITGERREDESKRVRGYEYSERTYGAFARTVTLPRGVDVTKIDADFRAGVLEIHVPKSEASRARRIALTQEQRVSSNNGPGIHAHASQMRVL
jgi:HSP20 family protein